MKKILFIFALSLISIKAISQNEENNFNITHVNLKINHSRRIPDSQIFVDIKYIRGKHTVRLTSTPKKNSANLIRKNKKVTLESRPYGKEWEHTKIDTTFFIGEKKFEDVKASLKKIDPDDFFTYESAIFLDGYSTKLSYIGSSGEVSYGFSNPNITTESRGLSRYMCTCALILETAGLGKGKISYLLDLKSPPQGCD